MKSINRFSGPIVDDLDYTDIKPNQMVFPGLNARIFNKKGQGLIATNINGTKYSEDEEIGFKLSDGFVFLGAAENNGIAFIVSYNPTTDKGEIGSFPSPLSTDGETKGFQRRYNPLYTFKTVTTGDRLPLTSELFGFDLDHKVTVIVRKIYDNTFNIYIADGKNPNKVLNSGFDIDGVYNDVFVYPEMFSGSFNHVLYTNKPPVMEFSGVETVGSNKPGNYFIYARYLTKDFNSTPFLTTIGPIAITRGKSAASAEGKQEKDWINNIQNIISKKITFKIFPNNLDTAFKYVQFAVLRYSAFEENGDATYDTYVVDRKYLIADLVASPGKKIEIRGDESELVIDIDTLFQETALYNISKNHLVVNDRYVPSNFKSQIDYSKELHDGLKELAQLVTVDGFDTSFTISDYKYPLNPDSGSYGYSDPNMVTWHMGYFGGEIYPFAIHFVFRGGVKTNGYPIKSYDAFQIGAPLTHIEKSKGLVRFPNYRLLHTQHGESAGQFKVLKIRFQLQSLKYAIAASKYDEIIGFYISRGNKIDNLITQGLLTRTTNAVRMVEGIYNPTTTWFYFDNSDGTNTSNAQSFPIIKNRFPVGYITGGDPVYINNFLPEITEQNGISDPISKNKFSLFSIDNFLSELFLSDGQESFIQPVLRIGVNGINYHATNSNFFPDFFWFLQNGLADTFPDYIAFSSSVYKIEAGLKKSAAKFASLFKDGYTGVDMAFKRAVTGINAGTVYNRSCRVPSYIGVVTNDPITTSVLPYTDYFIVNLYREENTIALFHNKLSAFDIFSEEYSFVSSFIKKSFIPDTIVVAGGDCFKQRSYFRFNRWFGKDTYESGYLGKKYDHGIIAGVMLESKVNIAARNKVPFYNTSNELGEYTFFPRVLEETSDPVADWLLSSDEEALIEAFQINDGYSKVKNPVVKSGIDDESKVFSTDKPNRIYYSNPAISGSIIDQFREINFAAYIDLPLRFDEIVEIIQFKGKLLCVGLSQLFEIFADERAIQQSLEGGNVLASTAQFISDRTRILGEFGAQDKASIVVTDNAVYGVDGNKKIVWRASQQLGKDTGSLYLTAENLSTTKFIQKWLHEKLSYGDGYNDIINNTPSSIHEGTGVVASYNREFDEIYFTFLNVNNGHYTLVFSEIVDGFIQPNSLNTFAFVRINNDLYFNKVNTSNGYEPTNEFHKMNDGLPQTFFDEVKGFEVSFIVNGAGDEQNSSMISKIFDSLEIEMSIDKLTDIIYQTEYQKSEYDFMTEDKALEPEYLGHKWNVPVTMQTESLDGDFMNGSEMTGTWMKVTLKYNPVNDPKEIYIRKIITNFTMIND